VDVQTSIFANLGLILNNLNRFFKHEIISDLWEMEKFSVTEAMQDYEAEKKTEKLWGLTKAICDVEKVLRSNPVKYWREI